MSIFVGILLVVHGLIHLLYAGQSARLFALKPGLAWPDGAWALAGLVSHRAARRLASGACLLAAAGFLAGAIGLFAAQAWWQPVTVATAAFSAAVFILGWDGRWQALADKGLVAVLIDLGILVALLVCHWPRFGF